MTLTAHRTGWCWTTWRGHVCLVCNRFEIEPVLIRRVGRVNSSASIVNRSHRRQPRFITIKRSREFQMGMFVTQQSSRGERELREGFLQTFFRPATNACLLELYVLIMVRFFQRLDHLRGKPHHLEKKMFVLSRQYPHLCLLLLLRRSTWVPLLSILIVVHASARSSARRQYTPMPSSRRLMHAASRARVTTASSLEINHILMAMPTFDAEYRTGPYISKGPATPGTYLIS